MHIINSVDLATFRAMPGWVLIEFYANNVLYEQGTGRIIASIPESWQQHENTPTRGTVIKVCKHAACPEWETEVELKENDMVFFDYKALMRAQSVARDGKLIFPGLSLMLSDQSKVLLFVPYHECYAYMRKEGDRQVFVPINGYMLVEDVLFKEAGAALLSEMREYRYDFFRCRIKHLSKPVKYKNKGDFSHPTLKEGDVVTYRSYAATPLQHPAFSIVGPVRKLEHRHVLSIDSDYDQR